jgi:hypothetical protein
MTAAAGAAFVAVALLALQKAMLRSATTAAVVVSALQKTMLIAAAPLL